MKRYLVLLLISLTMFGSVLSGCTSEKAPAEETYSGEAIKFMTYNICASYIDEEEAKDDSLYISARYQNVFDVINHEEPDVLCITEFNSSWYPYFQKAYMAGDEYDCYGYSSMGNRLKRLGDQWDLVNLVMYRADKYQLLDKGRFWCSSTPDTANSYTLPDGTVGDFGRCINWVKLESMATGQQFYAVAAHIDAKHEEVRDFSTTLISQRMNEIAEGLPVVIMGDFNCNYTKPAYENMIRNGYENARELVKEKIDIGTYNAWDPERDMKTVKPIDQCFLSKGQFEVSRYRVVDTVLDNGYAPSDHYPITVMAYFKAQK